MIKYIVILIIFTFAFCGYNEKIINRNHVVNITIKYVDFDIETPIDIGCIDFEESFSNFKKIVIEDSMKINQILSSLSNLKVAGKEKYQFVDTRLKLELYYQNDSMETICMDRFIINWNNQVLQNSDSIIHLLTNIKN